MTSPQNRDDDNSELLFQITAARRNLAGACAEENNFRHVAGRISLARRAALTVYRRLKTCRISDVTTAAENDRTTATTTTLATEAAITKTKYLSDLIRR